MAGDPPDATTITTDPEALASAKPGRPASDAEHLRDDGVVARGGFGSIHKVYDQRLLRQLAMKVLEKDNPRALGRFIEEGQICAQLEHPHIVPVHEAGTTAEGKPFFTMKLVRGLTLGRVVRDAHEGEPGAGPPSDEHRHAALHQTLEIFLRVCDAVAFAHDKGVLHRDLKPDNIMVGTHGQVYLMDWGIAHVLGRGQPDDDGEAPVRLKTPKPPDREGSVAGTPTYMAPEQALGLVSQSDERTDVFSLGAILYFILTGTPPYRGQSMQEKLAQAQAGVVEPPEARAPGKRLPPGLCQIAMKAMAFHPSERYPTATALRLDLERFLRGGWWFETRTFAPGELVLEEGAEAEEAFIITSGQAEAFRGPPDTATVLSVMGSHDVFGEMAIFTDKRRTASVRAKTALEVMVITRASVDEQFGAESWTGLIVKALARRFRELDERTRARASRLRPSEVAARRALQVEGAAGARPGESLVDAVVELAEGQEPKPESFRFEDDTLPRVTELLRQDRLDEAALLYEPSEGALAGPLLAEAEDDAALAGPLAELFTRARDFAAAGRATELAGDLGEAARLYEQGDAFFAAASCYRRLGELEKAAGAYERGGDRPAALKSYQAGGGREGMADLLVREGRYADAAAVYRDLGDVTREVEMLRLVPVYSPARVEAALRLAALYAQAGEERLAAQLLIDTLQGCEGAWSDNRVAVALAPLLTRLDRDDDADKVMTWARAQADGGEVPSLHSLGEISVDLDETGSTAVREALRRADPEAYQVLKQIRLFADLSLVDMKDLYRACEERVYDAGTLLTEAGRSPGGLYVLLEGRVEVRLDGGEALSTVGPGETLGEISLVTDGPATATARSVDKGRALFIARERFDHYLYHHPAAALRVHRTFNHILAERMTVLADVTGRPR